MADLPSSGPSGRIERAETTGLAGRLRRMVLGRARDLHDRRIFHQLALIPFLAWVGMGADGLSSTAYGPSEAFKAIGEGKSYVALALAAAIAGTVLLLSAAYSVLIEAFPSGGGYVVATRMLGRRAGLVSGCALLVDYVLTITASTAAACEALFALAPKEWSAWRLETGCIAIALLTVLNLRGVRESVMVLTPVFLLFVLSHAILIGAGLFMHLPETGQVASTIASDAAHDWSALGLGAMVMLFFKAYSMSGGTYTGIEAISTGVPLMREPKVKHAQRTMVYLAASLSICAAGLILCYLLWGVAPEEGKTMNAILAEKVAEHLPGGRVLVWTTLLSSAFLLVTATQAGFMGGPRTLANLALDSWVPRRLASLSERLTTANGVVLMGTAALVTLWLTDGDLTVIVAIYAINVFLTFTLTMAGMLRFWWQKKGESRRRRCVALFSAGLTVCATILCLTVWEYRHGVGLWAVAVTGLLVSVCLLIHSHYQSVSAGLRKLFMTLESIPRPSKQAPGAVEPNQAVAVVMVSHFGGVGIHTVLNVFKAFPNHFKGVVFVSVGVMDSGAFKGEDSLDALRAQTQENLQRYVELAHGLGLPATSRMAFGTDPVDEAARLCLAVARDFPRATFFAGKVVFGRPRWYHWLLHNDAALAVQRRLQLAGRVVVVMPARIL
ncbi:MAG: APC family permease [Planctomycetes bacterium]|nr:APC family permease [Planctomycetota bacterium]